MSAMVIDLEHANEEMLVQREESSPDTANVGRRGSSVPICAENGRPVFNKNISAVFSASSDDSSSAGSAGHASRHSSMHEDEGLDEAESVEGANVAALLRPLVMILFLSMCVLIPLGTFFALRRDEDSDFQMGFATAAAQVKEGIRHQIVQKLGAVESLGIAMTSHARSTGSAWPNVTIPDFDVRAEAIRKVAHIPSLAYAPLISSENRQGWETYVPKNTDWLATALMRQQPYPLDKDTDEVIANVIPEDVDIAAGGYSEKIYGQTEIGKGQADPMLSTTQRYLPVWQHTPVVPFAINFDMLSSVDVGEAIGVAMSTGNSTISQPYQSGDENVTLASFFDFIAKDFWEADGKTYDGQPMASLFTPVFDSFEEPRSVVAILTSILFFEDFFLDLLPATSYRIACVVENTCGSSNMFTFHIDGDSAAFLGEGDWHDSTYEDDVETVSFIDMGLGSQNCSYSMRLYPTEAFDDGFKTKTPARYAVAIAALVLLVSVISLAYDFLVQQRMKRVLKTARENRAIVSSLFPATVRDRLLKEEDRKPRSPQPESRGFFPRRLSLESRWSNENHSRRNSNENTSRRNSNDNSTGRRSSLGQNSHRVDTVTDLFPFGSAMATLASLAPSKLRLRMLMKSDETNEPFPAAPAGPEIDDEKEKMTNEAKPIADLFPNCTVLFADICGFTAWSSIREPEQVFTLLQTLFISFDQLAQKRDIFKVETIGDCYVAVTGLPFSQPDHAVRMTKYARACLKKVSQITKSLEVELGPGTGELQMRFGLHSGPVTAGVLRGLRGRFQLFGDTVNTASRMESTGIASKIQIHQSTAQLLIEAKKEHWIIPREDKVEAKGKGAIKTFWVLTKRSPSVASGSHRAKLPNAPELSESISQFECESVASNENGSVWDEEEEEIDGEEAGGYKTMADAALNDQFARMIDWQVDLMTKPLKQIVTGRNISIRSILESDELLETTVAYETVLNEVSDSIDLPGFDIDVAKARATPHWVQFPQVVIDELHLYVTEIAHRYRDVPFHCMAHASHVSMSAAKLLGRIVKPEDIEYHGKSIGEIASNLHDSTFGITSDPLTHFAILFATLVHDVDHSGITNQQRNIEEPNLARKYRSRSIAEQNSVDLAWDLLMKKEFSHLRRCIFLSENEKKRFRQLIVNLIMATDIFEPEMKAAREMRWEKVFHCDHQLAVKSSEFRSHKTAIIIEHIIQAADVAHTMQHWHVYAKWNERLYHEMYRAFEAGRAPKDPTEGWYKGELWFFDNYVIPLARKLEECGVFGVASAECLTYALDNRKEWAVKGEQIVADMACRVKKAEKYSAKSTTPALVSCQQPEFPMLMGSFQQDDKQSKEEFHNNLADPVFTSDSDSDSDESIFFA